MWGSYWHRSVSAPGDDKPARGSLPARVDYAVIGAGFAGLSTARELSRCRPGASILVLEAQRVGHGASGRNGGLLSPLAAPMWLAEARHDGDKAWAIRALNAAVAEVARALSRELPDAGITPGDLRLESKGLLTDAGLGEVAATLTRIGIAHREEPQAARPRERQVVVPAHLVHPYRLTLSLAEAARADGISIAEQTPVAAIETTADGARLTLRDGRTIAAGHVAVCANAYAADLTMPARVKAKAVHNYMLESGPLDAATLARLPPPDTFVVQLNTAYVFYRVHDGRLLFGGIDKLSQREPDDMVVPADVRAKLEKLLAASFPGLGIPIAGGWGGRFHMTATELPVIERAEASPHITLNVGYGGTGVGLSLVCARFAAAVASGTMLSEEDARLFAAIKGSRLPVIGGARFVTRVGWRVMRSLVGLRD